MLIAVFPARTIIVLYFKWDTRSEPLITKAPALQLFHKHFTVVVKVTTVPLPVGK